MLRTPGIAPRLRVVDPFRPAALNGSAQHGAVEHPRNLHVDRVLGRAIDLLRQFDPHHIPADQPEFAALLEVVGPISGAFSGITAKLATSPYPMRRPDLA